MIPAGILAASHYTTGEIFSAPDIYTIRLLATERERIRSSMSNFTLENTPGILVPNNTAVQQLDTTNDGLVVCVVLVEAEASHNPDEEGWSCQDESCSG